jgi:hypothetical protein
MCSSKSYDIKEDIMVNKYVKKEQNPTVRPFNISVDRIIVMSIAI